MTIILGIGITHELGFTMNKQRSKLKNMQTSHAIYFKAYCQFLHVE